jgi:hypothetical protein
VLEIKSNTKGIFSLASPLTPAQIWVGKIILKKTKKIFNSFYR